MKLVGVQSRFLPTACQYMREKEVMLSDEEHRLLKELKSEQYEEHVPLGWIVRQSVEEELDQ